MRARKSIQVTYDSIFVLDGKIPSASKIVSVTIDKIAIEINPASIAIMLFKVVFISINY